MVFFLESILRALSQSPAWFLEDLPNNLDSFVLASKFPAFVVLDVFEKIP